MIVVSHTCSLEVLIFVVYIIENSSSFTRNKFFEMCVYIYVGLSYTYLD